MAIGAPVDDKFRALLPVKTHTRGQRELVRDMLFEEDTSDLASRSGFFVTSFKKWRRDTFLAKAPPVLFDRGFAVLDSANVETPAYCQGSST